MEDKPKINLPLLRNIRDMEIFTPDIPTNRTPVNLRSVGQSFFRTQKTIMPINEFSISIELQPMQKLGSKDIKKKFKDTQKKLKLKDGGSLKLENIIRAKKQVKINNQMDVQVSPIEISLMTDYFSINADQLCDFFDLKKIELPPDLSDPQQRYIYQLNLRLEKFKEVGGIAGLQILLRTNLKNGIDRKNKFDLKQRRLHFGENIQQPFSVSSVRKILMDVVISDKIFLLVIALLLVNTLLSSQKSSDKWETFKYLIALLSAMIAVYCKAVAQQKYFLQVIAHQSLINHKNEALQKSQNVIRGGENIAIEQSEILVGDILIFRQGDLIQIDGVLTKQYDQEFVKITSPFVDTDDQMRIKKIHNFALPMESSIHDPFIFSGCQIIQGEGEILVLAVGEKTSSYKNFKETLIEKQVIAGSDNQKTRKFMQDPFSQKIQRITIKGGKQSIFLVMILVSILTVRLSYQQFMIEYPRQQTNALSLVSSYLDYFLYGVLLILIMVPINMVQILNFYMINVIKLIQNKEVLVEDYSTLYILGQVNELVVDKTGCLTKSEMEVGAICCEDEVFYEPMHDVKRSKLLERLAHDSVEKIFESICINSKGLLHFKDESQARLFVTQKKPQKIDIAYQGSRNELALLKMAFFYGYDYKSERKKGQILKIFPFKSDVKRMITLHHKAGLTLKAYIKGAPYFVLNYCSYSLHRGKTVPIQSSFIKEHVVQFGQSMDMKLVVLAEKEIQFTSENNMRTFITQCKFDEARLLTDATFVALVGIKDPIRVESYDSVQALLGAKINVRLFTGDNIETAISSAKKCGIIKDDDISNTVLEGDKFRQIVDECGEFVFKSQRPIKPKKAKTNDLFIHQGVKDKPRLAEVLSALRVLAKASAKDKEILLSYLKLFNRIVCLTGDDAENSRAVEQAHIGVGLAGSETKSSIRIANVVLLNDSIAGIQDCVAQGRGIYFAFSNLVQAYACSSLCLYLFCVCSAILRQNPIVLPLPTLMLLIVFLNFISLYTLLSLNTDITQIVMKQPPYKRHDAILSRKQINQICFLIALISIQLVGVALADLYELLHPACSGLILIVHVEGLSAQARSNRVKCYSFLVGLMMVFIQWQSASLTENENDSVRSTLEAYCVGFVLIELNCFLVRSLA